MTWFAPPSGGYSGLGPNGEVVPRPGRPPATPATASGIRAAAQREDEPMKPYQITTLEELDELPIGSIVADLTVPDSPAVACRAVRGWQMLGDDPERRYLSHALAPNSTPLTVLHRPDRTC
jgi:hypothetical protein